MLHRAERAETGMDGQQEVSVRALGTGQPVWLFHSLLADAGSCLLLAQRLRLGYRVLLPDLPGFGGSAPAGPALEAVADRMAKALERGASPAGLFGNRYGSFNALVFGPRRPPPGSPLLPGRARGALSPGGRAALPG